MHNIEKLKEIASFIGMSDVLRQLEAIAARAAQDNAPIILPLVGEFSSGKTSLLNALTDSHCLQTATRPTTATIFELHFGSDRQRANALWPDGREETLDTTGSLDNEQLQEAEVVTVFDTSHSVPSTTVLADTPGLSSPDRRHQETLVSFLPKADGLLLVCDINQSPTRSLLDFIDTVSLSHRPMFLILTKGDTKPQADIEAARQHAMEVTKIPRENIAVVSAQQGDTTELLALLDSIQRKKKDIIAQADDNRLETIATLMAERIDELLTASASETQLTEAISETQATLNRINRAIERIANDATDDINDQVRSTARAFEDTVQQRLNTLVAEGKSDNFDSEALSIINNTATLLLNDCRNAIHTILREKAKSLNGTNEALPTVALDALDLDTIKVEGLSYDINLNEMGHQYDGYIKTGVIAAAAVATVAAVAATGGAAAVEAGELVNVADTASDIGSIIYNSKAAQRIEAAVSMAQSAASNYNTICEANQQIGQQTGQGKGIIDSMVGFVAEKTMAKPQRQKAIRDFVGSRLSPNFLISLQTGARQLTDILSQTLRQAAQQHTAELTAELSRMRQEAETMKEAFDKRQRQLRQYRQELV